MCRLVRRNEVFLRLKTADLHGGKLADKNIEAVICLLDDQGNPVPNCVEVVTPDKLVHKLSHHSRVLAHEDRPKFDEIVKLRLPKYGVKNLHVRILFYNRKLAVAANEKVEKKADKVDKGPFAMCFLHVIRNYVMLCEVGEDELLVYRQEKVELRQ
uniref:C2 DOCK-type domain-containing protein n=1 Tax=Ditylenchus dipsaci TaxID=166011 RepID=A0A915E0Z9_9BILA